MISDKDFLTALQSAALRDKAVNESEVIAHHNDESPKNSQADNANAPVPDHRSTDTPPDEPQNKTGYLSPDAIQPYPAILADPKQNPREHQSSLRVRLYSLTKINENISHVQAISKRKKKDPAEFQSKKEEAEAKEGKESII